MKNTCCLFKLIFFFLCGITMYSQDRSIFEDKQLVEKWLNENKIPTLGIGVIEEGKIASVNVYGNLNNEKAAPDNTIFNVAYLENPVK